MKFHIIGDEAKLELDVIGRSHPDCLDYWDGNWITTYLKIDIPGYHVSFPAHLRTDELEMFLDGLKEMNKMLKGKAELNNMDSYLHFECIMDKFGKITWTIDTVYPPAFGAKLHFDFQSDQSYLPNLIKELNEILILFPVIGKP